ncbi:MAG: hypothetical protein ABJB12_23385 [Pseudomonadota bacterium]
MLKINEFSSVTGVLSAVYVRVVAEQLEIVSEEGSWPIAQDALRAVLTRFGAPFDPGARAWTIAILDLPGGEVLRHVRHLAGYDVIARDYLVYEAPREQALCALAATVSAALLHLGKAANGKGTM